TLTLGLTFTGLLGALLLSASSRGAAVEEAVAARTADLAGANADLAREVRERQQAEAALRESEARLAEAQRIARLRCWQWEPATDAGRWSDELYRVFGLPPGTSAVTCASFRARVHPEDLPLLEQKIRATLGRDAPSTFEEFRIVRPDGTVRVLTCEAHLTR